MRIVSAADVDAHLNFPDLIDALDAAFANPPIQPVRHHHTIEGAQGTNNTLLLMPAWHDMKYGDVNDAYLGVKIVTVAPDNGQKSLPAVMGTYLLMRAATGEVLAAIDGQRLTVWRTAAASALAARYLARPNSAVLAMMGAGALAPFLVKAHASVRPIKKVIIWNRSRSAATRLAAELSRDGFETSVTLDADEAVAQGDIVSAATLSTIPIIRGAVIKSGAHIDLVGAFTPLMRETDDQAVSRAEVYVDTRAGALKEGGDLVQAIASGAFSANLVRGELSELAQKTISFERSANSVTLFKSVGAALEDLAAATLLWNSIQDAGQ